MRNKDCLQGLISRLNILEKRISEFIYMLIEMSQTEMQRRAIGKNNSIQKLGSKGIVYM